MKCFITAIHFMIMGVAYCSLRLLDGQNFTQMVVNSDKVWVVEFYSPHCSLCNQFQPEWNTLIASEGRRGLEFGQVNIDDWYGYELARDMGVFSEGLPNVKVFPYEFDPTGILVWNGFEWPALNEVKFKLKSILADHLEESGYRKLPHLLI